MKKLSRWLGCSLYDFLKLTGGKLTHEQFVVGYYFGRDDIEHAFRPPYTFVEVVQVFVPGELPEQYEAQQEHSTDHVENQVDVEVFWGDAVGNLWGHHE